jgi:hypothetical protein
VALFYLMRELSAFSTQHSAFGHGQCLGDRENPQERLNSEWEGLTG